MRHRGTPLPLMQPDLAAQSQWLDDSKNPDRGPMLIISGEKSSTAPPAITDAIYKQQSRNPGVTGTVLSRSYRAAGLSRL